MLTLNAFAWTLLPALLEGSIRLDVAEHVIQGREWLLAYPKHPPLSMWLVDLVTAFGPARYPALYLMGQTLALSGLVSAAFVLRDEGPAAPTLAILIGLSTPFLSYMTIQVNHNIAVMPFWGVILTVGYRAFTRSQPRHWLLLGIAVGIGMWAKYSILHLILPLALAFLVVPAWRRKMCSPWPWFTGLLASAIVTAHFLALQRVADPFAYALRTFSNGFLGNLVMCLKFLLNAVLMLLLMAVVAAVVAGVGPLFRSVRRSFADAKSDQLTLYLQVALFGPIGLIAGAALLFGVRPRFHWLTPTALSGAVWWAHAVWRAHQVTCPDLLTHRAVTAAATVAATLAAGFVAVRLLAPIVAASPSYPDFDGPKLARLAERTWRPIGGDIPYIVSFGDQRGRQAAGSILFDSSARSHVFENADHRLSPWIDVADLALRGALVVSTRPLLPNEQVAGRPIEQIAEFERPTVRARFRKPPVIYFGVVPPVSEN